MQCLQSNRLFFGARMIGLRLCLQGIEVTALQGTAAKVIDPVEKRQALLGLVEKYSSPWREQGIEAIDGGSCGATVYKIVIQHTTGKIGR